MLTFIEERRQRIRKAWEESYAEGFEEGRIAGIEEARAEILAILRRDPRMDAMIRDDSEFREALHELGFDLSD